MWSVVPWKKKSHYTSNLILSHLKRLSTYHTECIFFESEQSCEEGRAGHTEVAKVTVQLLMVRTGSTQWIWHSFTPCFYPRTPAGPSYALTHISLECKGHNSSWAWRYLPAILGRSQRQEDQGRVQGWPWFITSWRPTWPTWESVSINKKANK